MAGTELGPLAQQASAQSIVPLLPGGTIQLNLFSLVNGSESFKWTPYLV